MLSESAPRPTRLVAAALGFAAADILLPAVSGNGRSTVLVVGEVALIAVVVAARYRASAIVGAGAVLVVASAWLLTQTVEFPLIVGIGVALGVGLGLIAAGGSIQGAKPVAAGAFGAGLVLLVGLRIATDAAGACATGAAIAMVSAATRIANDPAARRRPRSGAVALSAVSILVAIALTAWIGANSASATWFGEVVSHGPRNGHDVALTFDDGPNATATLAVRAILDRYGAKATFFEVGRAVDARPDIARALLRDGQLLGNHSYHHDSVRWLDPRYLELERTQRALSRAVGVCPTFFRPPHGQHTPSMARVVSTHDMTMVTWDVSAADWATRDAALVARRVLDQVRPGSIILLHDGLDGHVGVDRTVVVRALPAIMEGLRQRGLHVVRLDVLLGRQPYSGRCS